MSVVYAKQSCAIGRDEVETVNLVRGQAWDAGSEIVREYPHLFEAEPEQVQGRITGVNGNGRIERATARPGERRGRGNGTG